MAGWTQGKITIAQNMAFYEQSFNYGRQNFLVLYLSNSCFLIFHLQQCEQHSDNDLSVLVMQEDVLELLTEGSPDPYMHWILN